MPVALRIVNDISCVSTITHDIHFAWQAQYLVRCDADACHFAWQVQHLVNLECVLCCFAYCKERFICEHDQ